MTGKQYADLIASYLVANFGNRGLQVYREINIGKSVIGKNRRIDILVLDKQSDDGFAIECKFQDTAGTVDEKIPYALEDMKALQVGGCITYAGHGFSHGVLHMLQASEIAAYCLPVPKDLAPSKNTSELDSTFAHFNGVSPVFLAVPGWRLA